MEQKHLAIRMFGDLSVEYDGKTLHLPYDIHSISVRLLVLLWNAGAKGVSRDLLLEWLYGENDVKNPSNSMRVNIYRARKMIESLGLPGHSYIVVEHGTYRWDAGEAGLISDVELFGEYIRRSHKSGSSEEKISLLRQAHDLYKGEFLPALATEHWAIAKRLECQRQYIETVSELCCLYKEKQEYGQLVFTADRALGMYTYEPLAVMKIDALLAQGYFHKAMDALDDISRMMFEELGVMPSDELIRRYESISSRVSNAYWDVREIKSRLEEPTAGGAYYCPFPSFVDCYRILKRISRRNGEPICLVNCVMTDMQGNPLERGSKGTGYAVQLMQAIEGTLRSGDVYTRSSGNRFLIMLSGLTLENSSRVMERIDKRFHESGAARGIKLDFGLITGGISQKN